MSSERLKTQVKFEDIVSGNDINVWSSLTKAQIKAFSLTAAHVSILDNSLRQDALDFYYKGLLSLYEGIIAVSNKGFSWATVKLYYSVYYFLRCSLCCHNIGFIRKERDAYHFENKLNASPIANGKPDHMAAIDLFKKYFFNTDFLQSNTLNNYNAYDWMRQQREHINYKNRTFFEPDIPPFWEAISVQCDSDGIDFWIRKYIEDDIYPFLEDNAVLAVPIRRLILTQSDLISKGHKWIVARDKEDNLSNHISMYGFLTHLKRYNRVS